MKGYLKKNYCIQLKCFLEREIKKRYINCRTCLNRCKINKVHSTQWLSVLSYIQKTYCDNIDFGIVNFSSDNLRINPGGSMWRYMEDDTRQLPSEQEEITSPYRRHNLPSSPPIRCESRNGSWSTNSRKIKYMLIKLTNTFNLMHHR